MCVGDAGRSARTRKQEHVDAVMAFNTKKSALSRHVVHISIRSLSSFDNFLFKFNVLNFKFQVGIGVALKLHHKLSSLFRKPKDVINFEQKRGLVYQISCRDCNAVYVGETERSVRTRKREHADAVKTFNTKQSTLSQHAMEFDHRIDWDNVKILKSESHAYRRHVAESF